MFRVTTLPHDDPPRDESGKVDDAQDFFSRPAYLTVSGQLEGEIGALALSRVYTFGPTFRAENSNTARHLAEFWMVEPEAAFYDLAALADLAERFLKSVFRDVLDRCEDDMAFFEKRIESQAIERMKTVIELRHRTGHPVVLLDGDALLGVVGDDEIYRGMLRQTTLAGDGT